MGFFLFLQKPKLIKMKKLLFIIPLAVLFFSCSSDDSSKEVEVNPNPSYVEWVPNKIDIGNALATVYSLDYPHQEGCEVDFIRIIGDTSAVFIEHEEGTCNVSETAQEWNRSGNQISFTIFETQISGSIIAETNSQMIIEADASQFTAIIITMNPEFADYAELLNTLKVKITLDKK